MCFSPYLGVCGRGGGGGGGLGHNLLLQFSSLGSSKILTIQNVLDPIHMLFSLFGCLDVDKGLGHVLMQFSTLGRWLSLVPLPSSSCIAEGNRI